MDQDPADIKRLFDDGYTLDSNGRWHRKNGEFASYDETGLDSSSSKSTSSKADSNESTKPYANSRPSFRKGVVEAVWEKAKKEGGGVVRDPNTKDIIEWEPGTSRNGVWDMGHIPDEKYSKVHSKYMRGEMTTEEFLDWYNNPDNYRPELPSNNRGHKYE